LMTGLLFPFSNYPFVATRLAPTGNLKFRELEFAQFFLIYCQNFATTGRHPREPGRPPFFRPCPDFIGPIGRHSAIPPVGDSSLVEAPPGLRLRLTSALSGGFSGCRALRYPAQNSEFHFFRRPRIPKLLHRRLFLQWSQFLRTFTVPYVKKTPPVRCVHDYAARGRVVLRFFRQTVQSLAKPFPKPGMFPTFKFFATPYAISKGNSFGTCIA